MSDLTREDIERAQTRPGFGWMPGMRLAGREGRHGRVGDHWRRTPDAAWIRVHDGGPAVIDPTDPATGGCLLALLGDAVRAVQRSGPRMRLLAIVYTAGEGEAPQRTDWSPTLGEACIRVALDLGYWPGGGDGE